MDKRSGKKTFINPNSGPNMSGEPIRFSRERIRRRIKKGQERTLITIILVVAVLFGLFLGLRPNAYQVSIGDEKIGVIKKEEILKKANETVLAQLKEEYNAPVRLETEPTVKKVRGKKKDYIAQEYLVTYIRNRADISIEFRELIIDGEKIGIVKSEEILDDLLKALKEKYYEDEEVNVRFKNKVSLEPIYAKEKDLIQMDQLVNICAATSEQLVDYTVQTGDSLSKIASEYKTTIEKICEQNKGMKASSVLQIGQELKVKVNVPRLDLEVIPIEEGAMQGPQAASGQEGEKEETKITE